jgi:16S rRNA C967 or C1407 C5-methylase (RsmB/RsmF family)
MGEQSRQPRVKARLRGPEGFEQYYAGLFGSRWPSLRAALVGADTEKETRWVRENAFSPASEELRQFAAETLAVPGCLRVPVSAPWAERDAAGLVRSYAMDPASVLAAYALPLTGARSILDLCAAPGGKSLILAERAPADARLVCNDRSPERRIRLQKVLSDHLPDEVRVRISITGHDGRSVGVRRPSAFDAVLLDAPCSSEEHVLTDPVALAKWSSSRSERLSRDQYALLTAALLALRPGGHVLYATCALSPLENDGVVQRLLDRGRHPAKLVPVSAPFGTSTEVGWQVLPDETGFGPMYFALLQRGD